MKQKKGFSLPELMVVIAIIAILSGLVMASLHNARMKARNAQRVAEFESFSLALKMYYIDHFSFPPSPNNCCSGGSGGTHNLNFQAVANALVSGGYLQKVPKDPLDGPTYAYMLYDYGPNNPVGQITVTNYEGISPTTVGPLKSCRPFGANWCSSTLPNTNYCVCHPY